MSKEKQVNVERDDERWKWRKEFRREEVNEEKVGNGRHVWREKR